MVILLIIIFCVECNYKSHNKKEILYMPKYTDIIAIENKENQNKILGIESKTVHEIGKIKDVMEIEYDPKKSVYVYLLPIKNGDLGHKNKIQIIYNNLVTELHDFYSACDIKLNSSEDKIVFRSYGSSSPSSAEGIRIYNLKTGKYIKLKSKVLVSGNLYSWLDENKLIYYGNIPKKRGSSKIYVYNTDTGKEKIYLDNIYGYCMNFINVGSGILYISKIADNTYLYYYNQRDKKNKLIDENISTIYESTKYNQNNNIFFIAEQKNGISAVYEFIKKNGCISRITYDYPKIVNTYCGIAEDHYGNVYFTGIYSRNLHNKMNIFVYNSKDKTTSVLSAHEGKYRIYEGQ